MSCSLWRYSDQCEGRLCPGDCEICDYEEENNADDNTDSDDI